MAQSPWTFDANGRLGVWTGTGYDFSAPTMFDQSALTQGAFGPASFEQRGDAGGEWVNSLGWGLNVDGRGWDANNSNYSLGYDPAANPNLLQLQMKSGDKQGTTIPYVRDPATGKWTLDPTAVRNNYWDTNTSAESGFKIFSIPAIGAAAYGAAAGLGAIGAGSGGGATAGMTAAEAAALSAEAAGGVTGIGAGGTTAAEAAAAAGIGSGTGAGGAGAGSIFEASYGAGTLGGEAGAVTAPGSAWGTTGASYVPGTSATAGFTPGAGVVAGEAGGTLAAPFAGGGVSASGPIDWTSIAKTYGGDVLKGITNTLIGRNQDRQARIGDQNFRDLQIADASKLRAAAGEYASGLGALAEQYRGAYDPFYAQVNNGVATSSIDPVTGKVGFNLNAPYQTQRDNMFGAANSVFGQMRDFNPQTFATERYNAAQALLAPGDATAEQDLMQRMFAKGGFGLTTNTPAAATPLPGGGVAPGTGSVGVNPYASAFANSRNQRNAEMSYRALGEGEDYLDGLIRRQSGLFGQGQAIDAAGAGVIPQAFSASNQFMGDRRTAAGFGYNAGREMLQIPYNAEREYLNAVSGANQRFAGNQAASDATKGNNYWDVANKLPWGDIWGKVSGWLF